MTKCITTLLGDMLVHQKVLFYFLVKRGTAIKWGLAKTRIFLSRVKHFFPKKLPPLPFNNT